MNLQPIHNIAEICHQKGIAHAILSPGSRCAPLTLAFARHPEITCKTISDERSAAFIALGMAQQSGQPIVLVCTSGSAAYNYAPAIAEAYFQQVPLIVITADRPPEWIDQLDGQTIRQESIYGKHVKQSYTLPVDLTHPDAVSHVGRLVNEAINATTTFPQGPVHINVPLREPFYPTGEEQLTYSSDVQVITPTESSILLDEKTWDTLMNAWGSYNRILLVGGQSLKEDALTAPLTSLIQDHKTPVLGDIISNLHTVEGVIKHADVLLGQDKKGLWESLQPDLLVTFGKSTISKNVKLLLRKHRPKAHWHIQPAGEVADTYQSLTQIIRTTPTAFLSRIAEVKPEDSFATQKQENYFHVWQIEERKAIRALQDFFPNEPLGELEVVKSIIEALPEGANLHLANSMSVRYANMIGLEEKHQTNEVFANRGTSGIDGSTSTTVGHSFLSDELNVLITGDLAFFYDRNAFWHNYDMSQLRIVLLNNHAGSIFRMIQGPADQPELEEYFETTQKLTAKLTAEEYDIEYLPCDKRSKLKNYIKRFFEDDSKAKILELETKSADSKSILQSFKKTIQNNG